MRAINLIKHVSALPHLNNLVEKHNKQSLTASIARLTRSDLINPLLARLLIKPAFVTPELLQAIVSVARSSSVERSSSAKRSSLVPVSRDLMERYLVEGKLIEGKLMEGGLGRKVQTRRTTRALTMMGSTSERR